MDWNSIKEIYNGYVNVFYTPRLKNSIENFLKLFLKNQVEIYLSHLGRFGLHDELVLLKRIRIKQQFKNNAILY